MGIKVEFNPDLALRDFATKDRHPLECLPIKIVKDISYGFRKKGQRNYWLEGVIPLCVTTGDGNLSRPVAAIQIERVTHRREEDGVWTTGNYRIVEVCKEDRSYFEGFNYIPRGKKNEGR